MAILWVEIKQGNQIQGRSFITFAPVKSTKNDCKPCLVPQRAAVDAELNGFVWV